MFRRIPVRRARARVRPITDAERRGVESDHAIASSIGCSKGFCAECEKFVDEEAGRLHRATCTAVAPERRRAS